MPKGKMKKTAVDKEVFINILKECGTSIIKLGLCEDIECTEKTIRRSLNEGKMTPRFLDQIAKHLNVDPQFLSGTLHHKANSYNDDIIKNIFLNDLKIINHPYFEKTKKDPTQLPLDSLLIPILALYEISPSQFESMGFNSQYFLKHDFLEALIPVIKTHFKENAYGRTDMPNLKKCIADLEGWHDDYHLHLHAEELRREFLKNLPAGISKSEIKRMDAEDLIALKMASDDDYNLTSQFDHSL